MAENTQANDMRKLASATNPLQVVQNRFRSFSVLVLARPGGFEPPTYRLEGGCSIR